MKRIRVTEEWPESWRKMLAIEPTKLEEVEAKLDGKLDWDRAELKMVLKFYDLIGFDVQQEEVVETDFDEMTSSQAELEAKAVEGWCRWMGEEHEMFWKDGIWVGTMTFCRGSREVDLADGRRFINWSRGMATIGETDGSKLVEVRHS